MLPLSRWDKGDKQRYHPTVRAHSLRRRTVILSFAVLFASISAVTLFAMTSSAALSWPVELWLDPNSSRDFVVTCVGGDTVVGTLRVLRDGDLFPQDQTKYDFWLYVGVNLLLLDDREYGSWSQGSPAYPLLERVHTSEASWSYQVGSSGVYHIVYWTDSVYGKLILVSHGVSSIVSVGLLAAGLVGLGATGVAALIRGRRAV